MHPSLSLKVVFLLLSTLALELGCRASKIAGPQVPPSPLATGKKDTETGRYTYDDYKIDLDNYNKATVAASSDALRNKITYSIMAEIDYAFGMYTKTLFLKQGSFNIGSDFLELGLASAGTITNGARGKTILSALLSGVTGTSLSVDKNLFGQQTAQAIISAMESQRDVLKTAIIAQLKQPAASYPFEAARADLIRYFFAGTLPQGLQKLHQDAGADAKVQGDKLQATQLGNVSPTDLQDMTAVHNAITQLLLANNFQPLIDFLKAMDVIIPDDPTQAQLFLAVQTLGRKTIDPTLRAQYFAAAKKANIIQ